MAQPLHEHWWLPALLAAVVGAFGLTGGFVYDDLSAITGNPVVNGELPWSEIVRRDFWGDPLDGPARSYRPLVVAVWRMLFPLGAPAFRVASLLLHVGITECLRRLLERRLPAAATFWAALLFAVHPVHAEAIGANVGQADLLGMQLGLAALLVGTRTWSRSVGTVLLLVASALCKETFVVFALVLVLLELGEPATAEAPITTRLARLVPPVLASLAMIAVHLTVVDRSRALDPFNNLGVAAEGGMRALWGAWVMGRGAAMCVLPVELAPNHGYAAVALDAGVLWPFAAVGTIVLLLLLAAGVHALAHRRLDQLALVCVFAAPLILQSNLVFDTLSDLAERLLYLPSAALCIGLGVWLADEARSDRLRWAASALVLAALPLTFGPIVAWRDPVSLWTRAARVEPASLRSQANLGAALLNVDRLEEGAYHVLVSQAIAASYPEPFAVEALEALERLAPPERPDSAPARLSDDPCALTDQTLGLLARNRPDVARALAPRWFQLHCGGRGPRPGGG